LVGWVGPRRGRASEVARDGIQCVAVVVELLLAVAVVLLIPVVVVLIDVALRLVLIDLADTGKLAVVLGL
jgi:hypothetical protein